jgi:hypothetical protein
MEDNKEKEYSEKEKEIRDYVEKYGPDADI